MCATCGCGGEDPVITVAGQTHDHDHHHHPQREPLSPAEKVLAKNDQLAEANRAWLAQRDILALNLTSSPGAGKTTPLERTIRDLGAHLPVTVVEGDQKTHLDAQRIRAAGCPVVQINTGA